MRPIARGAALVFGVAFAGLASAAEAPPGASSCSGCHAAIASADQPASLIGRPASEIVDAMLAYKSGQRPATIMDRVARGFSDEEVAAIAAWYAARKN